MSTSNSLLSGLAGLAGLAYQDEQTRNAGGKEAPGQKSEQKQVDDVDTTCRESRIETQIVGARARAVATAKAAKPANAVADASTKGACQKCGTPVMWDGPSAGLVNWFGEAVHLRCPTPEQGEPERFDDLETEPAPPPFDDAAFAQMRCDFREVEREWRAASRKRPEMNMAVYSPAEHCPTCDGTDWWALSVATAWKCRACEPPNARRKATVFRFAAS